MGSAEPGGSISGPLIISIMALSVLINLVCFVVIARLVKTAREKGATTPLQQASGLRTGPLQTTASRH